MVHGKNRIPYRIDRRLTGLAGPDYDATISFGLPFESEDSRYGKYRLKVAGDGEEALAVLRKIGDYRTRRDPTCSSSTSTSQGKTAGNALQRSRLTLN